MKRTNHVLARLCVISMVLAVATPLMASEPPIEITATFSILGDIAKHVGGDRVKIHTLVGPNADAHVYQPTPADAKALAKARLVVVNGLGFEGWLERLIKSSGYRGKIVTVTDGIQTLKRVDAGNGHDPADGQGDAHGSLGGVDPHAWQDPANALAYVDSIEKALDEIDPAGKAIYRSHAEKYRSEIQALDSATRQIFKSMPKSRLRVVTTHDAFEYFGRAYGIDFIAPVGINTDAEPSAADIGRIIKQIRRDKIPAVFMESISDSRLLERIRQESGAKIGGTLYSDALSGPDGPASTYLDMMRHNARTLADALKE